MIVDVASLNAYVASPPIPIYRRAHAFTSKPRAQTPNQSLRYPAQPTILGDIATKEFIGVLTVSRKPHCGVQTSKGTG